MSEIVFVLGAGASRDAGGPLMADFLDKAEALLKSGQVGQAAEKSFHLVFKGLAALQAVHSKATLDLENIESVFEAFEMAGLFGRALGNLEKAEVEELSPALRKLIARTLERTIEFPVVNDKGNVGVWLPPSYERFINLILDIDHVNPRSVSIITFNYDLALDYGFHWFDKGVDYCLAPGGQADHFHLLKLHGSLNWVRCPHCQTIVSWDMKDFLKVISPWKVTVHDTDRPQYLEISPWLENFQHKGNHGVTPEAVIVPPTWGKAQYHKEIKSVWQQAAQHLSEAEHIFILGYSLPVTDQFFHLLYALGTVGPIRLKRLWVFDPDQAGQVRPRYEQMLGQAARNRFVFEKLFFRDASGVIREELQVAKRPPKPHL